MKIDSGARTTSVYDAANRLTYAQDSTGRTTFTFDASGNQIRQTSPTLQITTSAWDFENMNTVTILPALSRVTLTYNGDQMRVEKDTASLTRKYVFDGQSILLETDGTNLSQAVYAHEPFDYGKLLSQRQNQSGTWVPINYSFDGLGSTDSLTDSNQVITDTYTYYAFGVIKATSGSTTNGFTWVGELGYVRDIETGEYELSLRQYLPDRARFKSQDPIGLGAGDPNMHRYVQNNPLNLTDRTGLQAEIAPPAHGEPTPNPLTDLQQELDLQNKGLDLAYEELVLAESDKISTPKEKAANIKRARAAIQTIKARIRDLHFKIAFAQISASMAKAVKDAKGALIPPKVLQKIADQLAKAKAGISGGLKVVGKLRDRVKDVMDELARGKGTFLGSSGCEKEEMSVGPGQSYQCTIWIRLSDNTVIYIKYTKSQDALLPDGVEIGLGSWPPKLVEGSE